MHLRMLREDQGPAGRVQEVMEEGSVAIPILVWLC